MTVGLPEQALDRGQRRLEPHLAAPPFEAFQQRGLLAADVGPGTQSGFHVEGLTAAQKVLAQQAVCPCNLDGAHHGAKRVRIFRADVDVALGGAGRDAGDRHALDQNERIALHQHPVGEGAAVALVGVANHVFLRGARCRHRPPLDAGREAGAAAAAQARGHHLLDDRRRRHRQRLPQALQPAMRLVIIERERIDDPATGEGEPLLFLQVGNLIDEAEGKRMASGMVARGIGEPGVEQARDITRGDRAKTQPAGRGSDLDQRLQPEQATAAVAYERKFDSTARRLQCDRIGHFGCTDRQCRSIAGDEDAHSGGHRPIPARIDRMRIWSTRPCNSPSTRRAGESAQLPRQ